MSQDKPTILVLSPDGASIQMLSEAVARDYTLLAQATVADLLGQATAILPELVVVDLSLGAEVAVETLDHILADPRVSDLPVLLLTEPGRESQASPLLERGALDVLTRPVDAVGARARISTAIALRQYRALVRRIISLDPVTGLANRRKFDDFMDIEWRRNLRNHTSMSLVMLDLDHFKTFEGRYGQGITRETLQRISEAISDSLLRAGDLVARLEGGKFACILPETDTMGAVAVAERMRAEVAALGIPHESSRTESFLTVSAGVAVRTPSGHDSPGDLLAEAERRLTHAKAQGRNRVIFD